MRSVLAACLICFLCWGAAGAQGCKVVIETPFASELGTPVKHYNRATPRLATAGALEPADIEELGNQGFDVVVDARPASADDVDRERQLVEAQGMAYYHLPYTDQGVTEADLTTFNALVADPDELRILLHCKLGNRAGALLARHYLSVDMSEESALMAGRAAGLQPETEAELLARLAVE